MSSTETVLGAVTDIVGNEHVIAGEAGRNFYSADISFEAYEPAALVAQPGSTEELAAIVERANGDGFAVLARGGGMSYTQGYTPSRDRTVLIDMRRMNKIREINTEDMYVIAEAGCTWEQLYETLGQSRLRTPYYGPLSGRFATVGGALSQNSVFWVAVHTQRSQILLSASRSCSVVVACCTRVRGRAAAVTRSCDTTAPI